MRRPNTLSGAMEVAYDMTKDGGVTYIVATANGYRLLNDAPPFSTCGWYEVSGNWVTKYNGYGESVKSAPMFAAK